ncbi:hypothetical protein ABTL45_19560, partial [Acinetobacter baumannii]
MANRRTSAWIGAAAIAAAAVSGCSGGKELLQAPAGLVTATTEAIQKMPLPKIDAEPTGSATEI